MKISCPECGFSRDVPAHRIPARNPRVTCPQCRCSFVLDSAAASDGEFAEIPSAPSPGSPADEQFLPAAPVTRAYAGFWIRFLAWSLDALLLGLVNLVFSLSSGLILGQSLNFLDRPEQMTVAMATPTIYWVGSRFLFATIFSWAYRVFFIGYCGQTPGKMAVRVKVIRTDGVDFGFGRAALREIVGKFCSKIILGIGYLMVAFDSRKQGLHDKIADTVVIKL